MTGRLLSAPNEPLAASTEGQHPVDGSSKLASKVKFQQRYEKRNRNYAAKAIFERVKSPSLNTAIKICMMPITGGD
jgi:hypothetical protein